MENIAERDLIFGDVLYMTDIVEVYKALMKATGEYVAVKKLKVNSISDATFYTNEALQMAALGNHPNIVKLRACFMSGRGQQIEYVLFVMKFYSKGDLQNEIERRAKYQQRWNEAELWNHMKSLIEVFSFLQEKNIAHRDIKPQNIFIGDNDELLVADLGCAVKKKTTGLEEMTLAGTPLYLSPLLRRAYDNNPSGGIDHNPFKSDVYSLGLTFYYMATLTDIFDFTNLNQLQARINIRVNSINCYSERIKNILHDMLFVEESERLDFLDLSKKYSMNAPLFKIIPNFQAPIRSKKINSCKVYHLVPAWGNPRIVNKVRLKKAKSKSVLESTFQHIYKGSDWSRFGEYLSVLCAPKLIIKISKLAIYCYMCRCPIDNDLDIIKSHDCWIHLRCIKQYTIKVNDGIWTVFQEGFNCYYNNQSHFHPIKEFKSLSCFTCGQYFKPLLQDNPNIKNSCLHCFCDQCLAKNPLGPNKECPECPVQWYPI
ncbi:unnamed protein product [Blepharisma stoltei]|uniref:Protein kinase domain-containing protein n=1 Tax=Blepharisma stoltei TaxID=1481888 RepID=A0AAU9JZF0_9CILI|nr:unnamed protein product [Blepharisma stoltei]